MARRDMSANDIPIDDTERRYLTTPANEEE